VRPGARGDGLQPAARGEGLARGAPAHRGRLLRRGLGRPGRVGHRHQRQHRHGRSRRRVQQPEPPVPRPRHKDHPSRLRPEDEVDAPAHARAGRVIAAPSPVPLAGSEPPSRCPSRPVPGAGETSRAEYPIMLHTSLPRRRQGVILLVVVSMLTLFAIVGLSFVMYAEAEAKGSQFQREAQVQFRPDLDPDLLAAFALGQLVTDVSDDQAGVGSALRGHSPGRGLYGWDDHAASPAAVNIIPFNGVGRLKTGTGSPSFPVGLGPGPQPVATPPRHYNNWFLDRNSVRVAISDHFLPNYQYHEVDGFIRDPERLG